MAASEDKVSKSTLSVERQLQRLQGRIDPLFKATRELDSSMRLLDRAVAQGSITETEHARALALVQTHYERAAVAAKNRATVTGAGRSVDYRNLSFQLNDVMTMGMMGANPSQIIASQGGQIFQSLQMAKGGVVGGLKEIGSDVMSLVGRFPLVTAGALAAGAAMTVFYAATRNGMPTAEQALERHAELVKKLSEQYRQSGAAVESFAVGSPDGVLKAYAKQNEVALRARYEEASRDLATQYRPQTGIAAANDLVHKSALAAPVDALMASVRDGKPDVLAFQRGDIGDLSQPRDARARPQSRHGTPQEFRKCLQAGADAAAGGAGDRCGVAPCRRARRQDAGVSGGVEGARRSRPHRRDALRGRSISGPPWLWRTPPIVSSATT